MRSSDRLRILVDAGWKAGMFVAVRKYRVRRGATAEWARWWRGRPDHSQHV
jgi:hypothetical protein